MEQPPPPRSFWCFISYRHADNKEPGRQWATWLHQQIETYEVPAELVGTVNGRGDVIPERIFPVFRDEDELPADADLSSPIYRALDASKFLVVLCSPRAVQSTYVADEIAYFKKIGGSDRVLAAILDGDPKDSFPVPLRHPVDEKGDLLEGVHAEPIAADFRLPDDGQGWTTPEAYRQALEASGGVSKKEIERRVTDYKARLELGKLKIIAGVLGIALGTLTKRDKAYQLEKERRRARIFRRVAAVMGVLTVAAVAGGVFAVAKKQEAETQRQSAVSARDAESAQRALAETRRVEADDARGVAEIRRNEAEQARKLADDAKALAEQRRLESETRLGRSNVLLAARLANESSTEAAAEALWEVPERERQWEWGYLLGQAYPEAHRVLAVPASVSFVSQGAALSPNGRSSLFWAEQPTDDGGDPVPGILRQIDILPDGSTRRSEQKIAGGLVVAALGRAGHRLWVDGEGLHLNGPDGQHIADFKLEGEAHSAAILDGKAERLVVKTDETWRILEVKDGKISERSHFKETSESEKFSSVSADGKLWVAVSDTAAALYDRDGKVVRKFPGIWAPVTAFSDDGTLAIATIDESVTLSRPDGKRVKLAGTEGVARRDTTGLTVVFSGTDLLVRSARRVRSWNLKAKDPAEVGIEHAFEGDDFTGSMAVSPRWVAIGLLRGGIVVFPRGDFLTEEHLRGHDGLVPELCFVSDDLLASAGEDGTFRHWLLHRKTWFKELLSDDPKTPFDIGAEAGRWLKFEAPADIVTPPSASPGKPYGTLIKTTSPDGSRSASTGMDGLVRLWKGAEAELLLTLQGPARRGESLAYATDGRRLGGRFMTPAVDGQFFEIWETEPWTRVQLGIGAEADWRKAYEQEKETRFKETWSKLVPEK